MSINRRFFVTILGAAAAVALAPIRAWAARPSDAFGKTSLTDALQAQFGSTAMEAGDIVIKAPEIAENGAVVPVSVQFNVPGAEMVSIIVENNPNPLAASFHLSSGTGNMVSTRIKMGKTSQVHAVVAAGGKLYSASKEVKVTIGGCGG